MDQVKNAHSKTDVVITASEKTSLIHTDFMQIDWGKQLILPCQLKSLRKKTGNLFLKT